MGAENRHKFHTFCFGIKVCRGWTCIAYTTHSTHISIHSHKIHKIYVLRNIFANSEFMGPKWQFAFAIIKSVRRYGIQVVWCTYNSQLTTYYVEHTHTWILLSISPSHCFSFTRYVTKPFIFVPKKTTKLFLPSPCTDELTVEWFIQNSMCNCFQSRGDTCLFAY